LFSFVHLLGACLPFPQSKDENQFHIEATQQLFFPPPEEEAEEETIRLPWRGRCGRAAAARALCACDAAGCAQSAFEACWDVLWGFHYSPLECFITAKLSRSSAPRAAL
jgi:hypothetical protein